MKPVLYAVVLFALAGWAQTIKSPSVIKPASLDTELHADMWCNIPGTLDDTCINNAIAALPATGGAVVLGIGNYSLAHTITVTAPLRVRLLGQGAKYLQSGGAAAPTHLTWTGTTGGTMISIAGTTSIAADFDEVSDMDIDCGGTAGVGLLSTNTWQNTYTRLSVDECTVADIEFTTVDTVGAATANKRDVVDTIYFSNNQTAGGDNGIGLWLTGTTTGPWYSNTNFSTFSNIIQWFGSKAPCLKISTGDANTFRDIYCYEIGTSPAGILLGDPAQPGGVVLQDLFYNISPGPKGFIQQAGYPSGPPCNCAGRVGQTTIYGYNSENGEPLPTSSAGGILYFGGLTNEVDTTISTNAGVLYGSGNTSVFSGFGTGASVINANGTGAFQVNVGTGGIASSGTIAFSIHAASGWNCTCTDITTTSSTVFLCRQAPGGNDVSVVLANYNTSGSTAAWASGDILNVSCWGR